jgi:hypothetical protein
MIFPPASHYKTVTKAFVEGRVVPLLGAGVNLCDRPAGTSYEQGKFLPSGVELAAKLVREDYQREGRDVECPHCHNTHQIQYPLDLLKVSQHMAVMEGSGPLYEELRNVFDANYQPSSLHKFLAQLPGEFRKVGLKPQYQLILTTNYDDVLERAFSDVGEPYDLVTYIADGRNSGKFWHWSPDGQDQVIDTANTYDKVSTEKRTVIMKLHGAIDRASAEKDSYVITEDHYIDFLAHGDITGLIPVMLRVKLRKSHFLFLGYSLRDWNLRVILHRIWGEQSLSYNSWAVLLHPSQLDLKFWQKRNVEILDLALESYIKGLQTSLPECVLAPPVK